MTQKDESPNEKEYRIRCRMGTKEILATPESREVMFLILETHGMWEQFTGLSDMTRDEAIGAHNVGVQVLNGLREVAPELVAMMITESFEREGRDNERSSRDDSERDRDKRPRFVGVTSA